MDPIQWGKYGWKFYHYVALGYPNNPSKADKEYYRNFYENLQHILPCIFCKKHYKNNLMILPLKDNDLNSRESLFKWTVNQHNLTNKQLGKKPICYKKALKCINEKNRVVDYILLFLLIIAIIIIIICLIKKLINKNNKHK